MSRKSKKGKSGEWLARQNRDPYVRQARSSGFRARAVYKLEQIDTKFRLVRPSSRVVDLGSAPGSWSQYVAKKLDRNNPVIAVDILPMQAVENVNFIQGDFTEPEIADAVVSSLQGYKADLVLSDMAPNITGIRTADQARAEVLQQAITGFCRKGLRNGGKLLTKAFEGDSMGDLRRRLGQDFEQVQTVKPDASRSQSREVYLLATGYRGAQPPSEDAL